MKIPFGCSAFMLLVAAAATLPAFAAPKKLLVVTVTTGFRHASIPTAEKVLAQLAADSGDFTVEFVRQPAGEPKRPMQPKHVANGTDETEYQAAMKQYASNEAEYQKALQQWEPKVAAALEPLSPQNLRKYDGVVFASTTGDLPLPDKAGFLKWIADGHAFIGMHAASDTFHGYPDFAAMVGGEFKQHGPQVAVDCLNDDATHPATKMLPARWHVFDEIYQFKNYDRDQVHNLLSLDRHPNTKEPGFYAVSWCKPYGKGRVFYTSLGHREDVWDPTAADKGGRKNAPEVARQYQQHILGGIRWALGLVPGNAEPQTNPNAAH